MQLIVPAYFNIYYNPLEPSSYPKNKNVLGTTQFMQLLYSCCLDWGIREIELDFRFVEKFTSAASTALFAHIYHLQQVSQTKFTFNFHQASEQLKLFKIALNANNEQKLQNLEKSFHPWQSGCIVNDKINHIIEYFNHLRNELNLGTEAKNTLSLLQTAIYEALMNVQDHAYLGDKAHFEKRWWQMLWCSNRNNQTLLNFIIYDLGVGVVESYQQHNQKKISPLLQHPTLIFQDAVKLGNSRSGEIERGNGLYEMLRPLEQKQVALWMYANNVLLRKVPQDNIDDCNIVPFSLPGTLIEWTFSLE